MGETEKLFLLLIEYLLYITTKILKKYFLLTSTTHSKNFLKSTFLKFLHIQYYFSLWYMVFLNSLVLFTLTFLSVTSSFSQRGVIMVVVSVQGKQIH
jgi:hypothetical protein